MARKRIALDQHRQAAEVLELFKGEPAGWRWWLRISVFPAGQQEHGRRFSGAN